VPLYSGLFSSSRGERRRWTGVIFQIRERKRRDEKNRRGYKTGATFDFIPQVALELSSMEAWNSFAKAWQWELRDERVDAWPLMSSPWPSIAICSAYVLAVTIVGPAFMRKRQPYEIKPMMQAYNLAQVFGSFWVFSRFMKYGWMNGYSFSKCFKGRF